MEINIINPASSRYHAIKDFKRLTPIKKGLTVAISSVVAVMTLGFLVTPVFRLLVKKWTVINDKKDTTTKQIDRLGNEKIARATLLSQQQTISRKDHKQKSFIMSRKDHKQKRFIISRKDHKTEEVHHEQKGSQAEELHHEPIIKPSAWHKRTFEAHDYDNWTSEQEKLQIFKLAKSTIYPKLDIFIHENWPNRLGLTLLDVLMHPSKRAGEMFKAR